MTTTNLRTWSKVKKWKTTYPWWAYPQPHTNHKLHWVHTTVNRAWEKVRGTSNTLAEKIQKVVPNLNHVHPLVCSLFLSEPRPLFFPFYLFMFFMHVRKEEWRQVEKKRHTHSTLVWLDLCLMYEFWKGSYYFIGFGPPLSNGRGGSWSVVFKHAIHIMAVYDTLHFL